jgi:hypothetical protein
MYLAGAKHVKFGMDVDYIHIYKFCMKYCVQINSYNSDSVTKL